MASIQEIIAAAPTTSNTSVTEMTNGTTEAIMTFRTRKAAVEVAGKFREAGATVRYIHPTPYKEWILVAYWTA